MTTPEQVFPATISSTNAPDNNMRIGVVSGVNPFRVNVQGGDVEAGRLNSYGPNVGDPVALLRQDQSWLALGATVGALGTGRGISDVQVSHATGSLALTTTTTTVTGTEITITTHAPNALALVAWIVDYSATGATATTGVTYIFINGATQTSRAQALFNSGGTETAGRSTVAQLDLYTIPTPGTQTILLRSQRSGGADGQLLVNAIHTSLLVVIFE